MKPVLFASNETSFTSQGIGALDCVSCIVTEERNGVFELEMKIATDALHYNDLVEGNIIAAIHDDTKTRQPFQIYKRSKPINGISTIHAEHISYRLSKIITTPFFADNVSLAFTALKSNAVGSCPFEFWTDKRSNGSFSVSVPCSIRSKLGGEQGSILDAFGGGEYKWDNFTVRLYQHRGSDNGVTLRKGKNITDYTKESDMSSVYTAIVPYYVENDEVMLLPEKYVSLSGGPSPYMVAVDLSDKFEKKPTIAELRTVATNYLHANASEDIPINAKVSFVALWQTEEYKRIAPLQRVNLCDTVTVVYDNEDAIKTKVIKTVYNVLLERYDEIELGEAKTNMSSAIKAITDAMTGQDVTKTEMQKALEHASELITGGLGGYVVFNRNANGQPQEILIMDKPDKETAVNVIRMNRNGIAFSKNGYNGPFNTAWTIDSRFVADFITAGTLTANIIKAGILGDKKSKNYWNMETGEFSLSASATYNGTKISDYVAETATDKADKAVDVFDRALNQEKVFNKLTNNGKVKGIYLNKNQLYINADYIKTGTLSADLIKSGTLSANRIVGGNMKSESGQTSFDMDKGYLRLYGANGYYDGGYSVISGGGISITYGGKTSAIYASGTSILNGLQVNGPFSVSQGNNAQFRGTSVFYGDVKNASGGTEFVSDRNKKKSIVALTAEKAKDFIMSLLPRAFQFKDGTSGRTHHGFIAQEVCDAMEGDDWGVYTEWEDKDGKTCGIRYNEIIADLVAVVQDQQRRIDALEERMC